MPNDSAAQGSGSALTAISLEASLTAGDIRKSVAWYRDVLGFMIDSEFKRGDSLFAVSLHAGAVRILLTQDDGSKGFDRVKGEGFSLQFTTHQDVDVVADRARSAGATLDTEPTDMHGARVFRLRDPDGFRLVISSSRDG